MMAKMINKLASYLCFAKSSFGNIRLVGWCGNNGIFGKSKCDDIESAMRFAITACMCLNVPQCVTDFLVPLLIEALLGIPQICT